MRVTQKTYSESWYLRFECFCYKVTVPELDLQLKITVRRRSDLKLRFIYIYKLICNLKFYKSDEIFLNKLI